MQEPQPILHPTDFCSRCDYAFHVAYSRAQTQKSRLVILHVAPPPVYGMLQSQADEYERRWKTLQRMQTADAAVPLEHILRWGDPLQEILRTAHQLGCQLIVMGSHGPSRHWLPRFWKGNVAEEVARRAACAVLSLENPAQTWHKRLEAAQELATHG